MFHTPVCTITITLLFSIGSVSAGEQTRQKRPLAELVRDLGSKKTEVRQKSIKILNEPFEGLPIEQWHFLNLAEDGSDFLKQARPLLPKMTRLLRHHDEKVVHITMMLMARMGLQAQKAAPALSRLAHNEKLSFLFRWQAVETMLFVTPETTSVLSRVMPQHDSVAPVFAMYTPEIDMKVEKTLDFNALGMYAGFIARQLVLSGHTQVEVSYLMKVATGKYPLEVRASAVMVLSVLVTEDRVRIPGLGLLLSDEDPQIREIGVTIILRTQKTSRLTPEMVQKLRLKDEKLKEIETFVRNLLKEEEKYYNELVAFVKDDPKDSIPMMLFEIRFSRGPARRESIRILGDAGPVAKPAVPTLLKMLMHQDLETQKLSANALQKIDPSALKAATHRPHEPQQYRRTIRRPHRSRCRSNRHSLRRHRSAIRRQRCRY